MATPRSAGPPGPQSTAQSAPQILQEPLPALGLGPHSTTSSARHRTIFTGKLGVWRSFEAEVRRAIDRRRWKSVSIPHVKVAEYGHVGDEHGVQGRFQERIGQVLSHISYHQPPRIIFADAKCAVPNLPKTPDSIIMTPGGDPIVVGEIKTPWAVDHDIATAVLDAQHGTDEDELRNMLGQIAKYMDLMDLKYGVLTTYHQTLFLRQAVVRGAWTLQLSPVKIFSDTTSTGAPQSVSVRECFWHLARLGLQNERFDRTVGANFQGHSMPWTIY